MRTTDATLHALWACMDGLNYAVQSYADLADPKMRGTLGLDLELLGLLLRARDRVQAGLRQMPDQRCVDPGSPRVGRQARDRDAA